METFVRGDKIKYPVLNIEYDTDTQTDNEYTIPIKIKSEQLSTLNKDGGQHTLEYGISGSNAYNLANYNASKNYLIIENETSLSTGDRESTIVVKIAIYIYISEGEYCYGLIYQFMTNEYAGPCPSWSAAIQDNIVLNEDLQPKVQNYIGIKTLTDDEILDILV